MRRQSQDTKGVMGLPLNRFPIANTNDVDVAKSVLSRNFVDLRSASLRNANRFSFEMNGISLGRTLIAFTQVSSDIEFDAGVIEEAVVVSLGVSSETILNLDGKSVDAKDFAIVSPGRRLRVVRTAGSGELVLRAGIDAIQTRYREMTGKEITSPIIFERSAKGFVSKAAPIRRFLDFLIDDANRPDTAVNNPMLRAGWDDMLLSMILALPNNYYHSLQCANRLHAGIDLVRRAEEFLEANASSPVSISDIVAEFHCTRSELFNSFRKHRGYAPLQFLAETRLRLAREALLRATTQQSVTSIALACGFSHLGRFSTAYRNRFGEKPSETLQSNY